MVIDGNEDYRHECVILSMPKKPYLIPSLKIDSQTVRFSHADQLHGQLLTDYGCVDFEICDGYIYCRSDVDGFVKNGILRHEWLPGIPGNGRFSNTITLNELVQSKENPGEKVLKQHRVYIKSWDGSLMMEVRFPLTNELKISLRELAAAKASK